MNFKCVKCPFPHGNPSWSDAKLMDLELYQHTFEKKKKKIEVTNLKLQQCKNI